VYFLGFSVSPIYSRKYEIITDGAPLNPNLHIPLPYKRISKTSNNYTHVEMGTTMVVEMLDNYQHLTRLMTEEGNYILTVKTLKKYISEETFTHVELRQFV
jgi:hypothetical protein